MAQDENRDIDLSIIFQRLKRFKIAVIISIYKGIHFIIDKIVILLVLIVVGFALGYTINNFLVGKKTINLIVTANFDSSSYLYSQVEMLNDKLAEKDTAFFKSIGLPYGSEHIYEIEVEPVINLGDILKNYQDYDDQQVLTLMDKVDTDSEFLKAETFNSAYSYHKITMILSQEADMDNVNNVLSYLENNAFYQQKRTLEIANVKRQRASNEYSLEQIDSLLKNTNKMMGSERSSSGELLILGDKNMNLEGVFNTRSQLMENNSFLDEKLVEYKKIFTVTNSPSITKRKSVMRLAPYLLPFVLVGLFLLYYLLRSGYKKISKYGDIQEV